MGTTGCVGEVGSLCWDKGDPNSSPESRLVGLLCGFGNKCVNNRCTVSSGIRRKRNEDISYRILSFLYREKIRQSAFITNLLKCIMSQDKQEACHLHYA